MRKAGEYREREREKQTETERERQRERETVLSTRQQSFMGQAQGLPHEGLLSS